MEKKSPEKKVSGTTFKIGAIALTFLIIGYQAAVFIHRTAILRIESLRDSPDTVYITVAPRMPEPSTSGKPRDPAIAAGEDIVAGAGIAAGEDIVAGAGMGGSPASGPHKYADTVRRAAAHSPVVNRVRERSRKAESFRFNPNTATVEELVRLGFSDKQAASIDNYRKKGGRFRRKEDFAKSFVVSDEIYRRLESFIDIPLTDINRADSAAFDALPGIGPYFAAKMVERRRRLCGYSNPEQLLDIYNFGEDRYSKLKDLVCCSPPRPYPLWSLPADSLRLHPYIGGWAEARGIVRFRENSPPDSLSAEALGRAGVLPADRAERLARCLIAPPQ